MELVTQLSLHNQIALKLVTSNHFFRSLEYIFVVPTRFLFLICR